MFNNIINPAPFLDQTANLLLLSSLKPLPRPASSHLHIVKVPIILWDRASELSSTGTVTVTLCPCQNGGMWVEERRRGMDGGRSSDGEVLMEWEKVMVCSSLPTSSMLLGFSSAAMLAILACSSVLMGMAHLSFFCFICLFLFSPFNLFIYLFILLY